MERPRGGQSAVNSDRAETADQAGAPGAWPPEEARSGLTRREWIAASRVWFRGPRSVGSVLSGGTWSGPSRARGGTALAGVPSGLARPSRRPGRSGGWCRGAAWARGLWGVPGAGVARGWAAPRPAGGGAGSAHRARRTEPAAVGPRARHGGDVGPPEPGGEQVAEMSHDLLAGLLRGGEPAAVRLDEAPGTSRIARISSRTACPAKRCASVPVRPRQPWTRRRATRPRAIVPGKPWSDRRQTTRLCRSWPVGRDDDVDPTGHAGGRGVARPVRRRAPVGV